MRLDVAVLQVLLTVWCAVTGNAPVVALWLLCRLPHVYRGSSDHPLHRVVASLILITALLQMLIACVFVPLWKLDTVDRAPHWTYLLLMPALEHRTQLVASVLPPVVTAGFVVFRWEPLTKRREGAPLLPFAIPLWAAPNIQWTTVMAAACYPTTPGMAFILLTAMSIAVRAYTIEAVASRIQGYIVAIVSALAMVVSFAFQNRFVRNLYSGSNYVVVPFLYDLSLEDGIPFFLHLCFGGAAAVVSSWVLEIRDDKEDDDPDEHSLLNSHRASLYGTETPRASGVHRRKSAVKSHTAVAAEDASVSGPAILDGPPSDENARAATEGLEAALRETQDERASADGDAAEQQAARDAEDDAEEAKANAQSSGVIGLVKEASVKFGVAITGAQAREKISSVMKRFASQVRHYLLVVPLLPVFLLSGAIIFFPSAVTLGGLPVVVVALLFTGRNYRRFMTVWVPVLCVLIAAQYCVLTMRASLPATTMRVFFATSRTYSRIVEVLTAVIVAVLLASSIHAARKYAEDAEMRRVERMIRQAHGEDVTATVTGLSNISRSAAIAALSSARLGGNNGSQPRSRDDPVQRALRAHARKHPLRRFGREVVILSKEFTYLISLLFTFIASTARADLDIIHAILLVMFVVFAVVPRAAARSMWPGLVAYNTLLTCFAVLWNFVLDFYTPPVYIGGGVQSSTIGTDTYSANYVAIPYFVALFSSSIEWRSICRANEVVSFLNSAADDDDDDNLDHEMTFHNHVAAIRDAYIVQTWNELSSIPAVSRWQNRVGLIIAGSTFVGLAVFEPRSFFVGTFLLLFLGVSVMTAYGAPAKATTVVWYGAAAFSFFAAAAVTLYQFSDIRKNVNKTVDESGPCYNVEPTCSAQIGLTTTRYALCFHLAPWMVAALVALGQARASRAASRAENAPESSGFTDTGTVVSDVFLSSVGRNSQNNLGATADDPRTTTRQTVPAASAALMEQPHAGPQRWLRDHFFQSIDSSAELLVILASHTSRVLVLFLYVALLMAEADILTLVYALFLVGGLAGKVPIAYATLHVMVVYVYQFSFVPELSWHIRHVDVTHLIGLHKSTDRVPPRSVMLILASFFASLLWDNTHQYVPTRRKMIKAGFLMLQVQRDAAAAFGYELLLAMLLFVYGTCDHTVVSFPVALLILITINFSSAASLLPSRVWLILQLVVVGIIVVGAYVVEALVIRDAVTPSAVPYATYLAATTNTKLLLAASIAIVAIQSLYGVRELMASLFEERALAHDGFRNLHEYLAGAPEELTESLVKTLALDQAGLDRVAPHYDPPREVMDDVNDDAGGGKMESFVLRASFKLRQVVTSAVRHVSPFTVAAFIYGASRTTVLGAYYITLGALCLVYIDHLNTRGYRVWRPLVWLVGVPLLILPPVLSVPPVADFVTKYGVFVALGVVENSGSQPMSMTPWHGTLIFAVIVHRRITEHFYATSMVRTLWREEHDNASRHDAVEARRLAKEDKDWAEWKTRQSKLTELLDKLRATMSFHGQRSTAFPNVGSVPDIPSASPLLREGEATEVASPSAGSSDTASSSSSSSGDAEQTAPFDGSPARAKTSVNQSTTDDASDGDATSSGDHESSHHDDPTEEPSEDETCKEKVKRLAKSAKRKSKKKLRSTIAWLAASSFRPEETRERIQGKHAVVALPIAAAEAFKTVTLEVAVFVVFLNAAQSATLWDCLAMVAMALIGVTAYPYPPLLFHVGLVWYTLVGVFAKALTYILVSHLKTDAETRLTVGALFIDVPDTRVSHGSTIHAAAVDLGLDSLAFIVLVLHWHMSVHNGVYRRADASPSSAIELAGSEEDSTPVRVKNTILAFGMRYYGGRKGVGHDLYLESTLALAVVMIVTCFGYFSIANEGRGSFIDSVQSDLLPGPMVAFLALSVGIMVADRAVYVLGDTLKKLILHGIVTLVVVIGVVTWHALVQTTNTVSFILLFALCVYLCFSGYQVKLGYPVNRRPDPFSPYPERIPRTIGYAIMRGVPFLSELRTLIDWSFEPTSLTLDNWLRVESVKRLVYVRQVFIVDQIESRGKIRPVLDKVAQGVTRLAGLLLLLIFPLIYYSTFNPSMMPNYVTSIDVSFSLSDGAATFEQSSRPSEHYPGNLGQYIARTRPVAASFNVDSKSRTAQLAEVNTCSSSVWPISPQSLRTLSGSIESVIDGGAPFSVGLDVTMTRQSSTGDGGLTQKVSHQWDMTREAALVLSEAINATSEIEDLALMTGFYNPVVFNQPSKLQFFDTVAGVGPEFGAVDCSLKLRSERDSLFNGTFVRYWCLKCNSLFSKGNFPDPSYPDYGCVTSGDGCRSYNYEATQPPYTADNAQPLYFAIVSELVPNTFSVIPNMGIIALYTTFVLAIGSVVRNSFAPESQLLIAEAADPRPLLNLLLFMAAARVDKDFELEMRIFLDLIDLLRNPAALLEATHKQRDLYDPVSGSAFEEEAEKERKKAQKKKSEGEQNRPFGADDGDAAATANGTGDSA